ncbi:hypothetical protein GOBAR_AA34988 [Gossypium barbadense]|uniref:Uncharacterized protein n=1 Tax=Gossypium barbadense TaxID=3634 RepID=A0A2P5W3J9_GOSBA|nr:hypothetical protein GOBAR_AA34988 [Gossypium barbadense]
MAPRLLHIPKYRKRCYKSSGSLSQVPPLLEQEPPAPWAFGRTGASGTIGNLGRRWCRSIRTLLLGRAGALDTIGASCTISTLVLGCAEASGTISTLVVLEPRAPLALDRARALAPSQPRPLVVREPRIPSALGRTGASGTIGTLVIGHGGALDTIGNLGPWIYGSLRHHQYPRPLLVQEPRTPSALGRVGASDPSAPWCLDGTIGNLGPWSCGSLEHHRQPRPLVVREPRHHRQPRLLVVREPRAPPAPWCLVMGEPQTPSATFSLGCMEASDTIDNLGLWSCGSLEHYRPLVVWEPRTPSATLCLDVLEPRTPSALGRARASGTIGNLGPWSWESLGTIGNLGPWSCGSLEHHRHLGAWMCGSLGHHRHFGAWMCGSLGQHRQPRPLVVREPRAPSAVGCAGASGTIGNLGPWSCESLGHHRQPRTLALGRARASGPSAPKPLVVWEPRVPSAPWCIGCAGGSSTKANFGPPLVQKRWHHKVYG